MALGDLIIKVGGNVDGFKAAMVDASGTATQFTDRIAATVSEGTTLFDAYGRKVEETSSRVASSMGATTTATNNLTSATQRLGSAHAAAVTQVQALSGALRVTEGNGALRAAERFLAGIPGLGAAAQNLFPVVGIIAVAEAVVRMGEHLGKVVGLWGGVSEAEKKATEEATKLEQEIGKINEDVARINLEQFAIVYGQTAAKANELADSQTKILSLQNQINIQQKDAETQAEAIAAAQKARQSIGLPKGLSFPLADISGQITAYKHDVGEIGKLQDELYRLQAQQKLNSSRILQGSADDAQKQRNTQTERDNAAAESARKTLEAWEDQKRRYEEAQKEAHRYQEALDRAADSLHKLNDRVTVSNRELSDKFQGYADKYAEGRAKIEAANAKKEFEPRPDIAQTPIEQTLGQRLQGTALGTATALNEAGQRTAQIQEAQIKNDQNILSAMQAMKLPIGEQLAMREKILEAQIALGESEGQSVSAQVIALDNIRARMAQMKADSQGLAGLFVQISSQMRAIPSSLGNSLSAGIFSGRGFGQEIEKSLKNAGQHLLGSVFTQAINGLARQLGINAALQTIGHAIMTSHIGVMLTHAGVMILHMGAIIFNTIATLANTIWTIVLSVVETAKAFFGFADGGIPPVGVPSIVGERGPELFIPHQAGTVIPNHALKSFANTGGNGSRSVVAQSNVGGNHTFNISGTVNPVETARQVARYLKSTGPQFAPASR